MLSRSLQKWATLISVAFVLVLVFSASVYPQRAQTASDEKPDAGSLQVVNKQGKPTAACPLKHTDVKAEISGFLSRVTLTQEFTNPFPDKIEAVYTFPLPQSAAVDDMTMIIGERKVKGKIMRRQEAQAAYENAKQMGQVASLLDQERPNIFTQSVANIMAGQEIRITISYVETLKYEAGGYEWLFPMVVGERYIPNSDQAFDSSRISPPRAERAGHDVSLEIQLDAGVPIQSLNSETHETEVERTGDNRAVVRLKDQATIPNKDFVLKYQVAGEAITDAILAHRTDRGGFFTLILQPPQRVSPEDVMPKELVFVLDTSGSMFGFPLTKAKETLLLALDNLYPHDTFNLITFAGETKILFPEPVPATPENLHKAKKLLASVGSDGGTEMMTAIKAALEPSDSQQHLRIVCFMTDGLVGNDDEILAEVQKHANARVFAMGFSDAPNRYLLDKMAQYGRGEVDYISEKRDTSAVAQRFQNRIRNPLLTDISIDWSGLPVSDVYPQRIPDVFSAKPVILSGRYSSGGRATIKLKGRMAGEEFVREVPIELPENEPAHDVLATLWARRRIDALMDEYTGSPQTDEAAKNQQQEQITQLGLDFRLMTQFTSFVAIDDSIFTGGPPAQTVAVPVETLTGQGGVACMVTVSSSQAELSTNSLTLKAVQELPIQGRAFDRMLPLTPGVVNVNRVDGADVSVNGQTPASNMFLIDGVSANYGIAPGGQSPGASAAGTTPAARGGGASAAAINEITITTANVEPQNGRATGAQISLVTKAGTNEFHGSLFHFFGNDLFDANDWFANSRNLGQAPRRLNNFGGTFGGPIVKDKTFLFGSYEGLRLRQPLTAITDVPSLDARQNAPDAAQRFLNAFPLPNGAATSNGFAEFAGTFTNPARNDAGSFRLDQSINANSMLTLHYNFADSEASTRAPAGFSLNTTHLIRTFAQTFTVTLNQTLSPRVVFNVSANYSRARVSGTYRVDQFGGAIVPDNFVNLSDASFDVDLNARGANIFSGSDAANDQRQFNLISSVGVVTGNHSYKFGGDYRRLAPVLASRAVEESLLFNGIAAALSGAPTRVNQLTHLTPQTPVFDTLALYAQDEWKKTPRLTLTYGIRWELNPAPNSDLLGSRLWKTTYANFAPRFNFASELSNANDARLILRGGVGVLYDVGQEFAGDAFVDSVPFLNGTSSGDASVLPASGALPDISFDRHLKLPYTINWNVSLQRELGPNQSIAAAYVASAGRRLLGSDTVFDEAAFSRFISSRAESNYRSLQVQFNRRFTETMQAIVSYTWAHSTDDAARDDARRVLLASANPVTDRGPSDFDVHHSLNGFVSYKLPAPFAHGLGNTTLRNWIVDSVFTVRSAKPVNVLFGFPTTYGFAYVRPDLVLGVPLYVFDPTLPGGRSINSAAFGLPSSLQQGTLTRNSLRGFAFSQFDLALRRKFSFAEYRSLQFQVDAMNVFNHPNFEDPLANDLQLGSTFGQSTAVAGARSLRFSLNFTF